MLVSSFSFDLIATWAVTGPGMVTLPYSSSTRRSYWDRKLLLLKKCIWAQEYQLPADYLHAHFWRLILIILNLRTVHLKGTRPPSGIATRLAGLCSSLVPYLENPLLLHLRFINGLDLCLAVRAALSPRGVRGWVGGLIESLTSCCACRVFGCAHQSIKESIWSYRSFVAIFLIITLYMYYNNISFCCILE